MKPLSVLEHYRNNKRKFFALFAPIFICTVLVHMLDMFFLSSLDLNYRAYVEPQKYFFSLAAKSRVISPEIVEEIQSGQDGYAVMPWVFHYTNIRDMLGGSLGTRVMTVKHDDMLILMKQTGLKLIKGRLPAPGSNEILLHVAVARSKNLDTDSVIGSAIQKGETIEGEKVVSGLVDGACILSFDSLEYWMREHGVENDDYSLGLLAVPLNGFDYSLTEKFDVIPGEGLDVRTLDSVQRQFSADSQSIRRILLLVFLVLILLATICTAFIHYIYLIQRRGEFSILYAMGYPLQRMLERIISESLAVNFTGFFAGTVLSVAAGLVMNVFFFNPSGIPLQPVRLEYLAAAGCFPLLSAIASIIPSWRMLMKMDPIAVLEGETGHDG